jgi:hypothetical protein
MGWKLPRPLSREIKADTIWRKNMKKGQKKWGKCERKRKKDDRQRETVSS